MGRPKKEKPNHGNLYEVKVNFAEKGEQRDMRSFYSPVSKEDARRKGLEARAEYKSKLQHGIVEPQSCTFEQAANIWLAIKKAEVRENTYQYTYADNVRRHLLPYFGAYQLRAIKPLMLQQFFAQYTGKSESLVHKLKLCLNGIFAMAIDNDMLIKNPMAKIKPSGVESSEKQVYTTEQRKLLVAESMRLGYVDLVLLFDAGLRRSELLAIDWDHNINLDERYIHPDCGVVPVPGGTKKGDPKSDSSARIIPISARTAAFLAAHKGTGYVVTGTQRYMSPSGYERKYRRRMKPMCERLGLPYLPPHNLRHTYGTELRAKGADVYTIQHAMGHADVRITSKLYVHNDIEVLRNNMHLDDEDEQDKCS